MSSLNKLPITRIPLFRQEENTGPLPTGKSRFWITGEGSDFI